MEKKNNNTVTKGREKCLSGSVSFSPSQKEEKKKSVKNALGTDILDDGCNNIVFSFSGWAHQIKGFLFFLFLKEFSE